MAIVLLDNIETGMELNSDVIDRQGRVLLKAGVCLTEKHLRIFHTWGILEVDIKGDIEQPDVQKIYSPELMDEANKIANILFQHNDVSHPVIKHLFDFWQLRYMDSKGN